MSNPPSRTGVSGTHGSIQSILILVRSSPFAQALETIFVENGYRVSVASPELVSKEAVAYGGEEEPAPSLIIVERQEGIASILRPLRAAVTVPIVAVVNGSGPCRDEEWLQDYDHEIDLVLCNQTPREVVARVRAILRRRVSTIRPKRHFRAENVRMDLDRHEVTVDGRKVELTPKEFKILQQFMEAPGRVFSRQEMLNRVWGEAYALEEHALDVHIHSLRQKIEADPNEPSLVMTVRGIGYKLRI